MTETRIIVDLDREATPDQVMVLQDGIEASIDHVVGDTLIPDRGYAGMLATFAGAVVTIGAGRLYQGGKVYAFDVPASFDVLANARLPVATKRIMLLIAYGQEQDAGAQPTNYVVESQSTPDKIVYKPQTVPTTHVRLAIVQDAYGDEGPNPVAPGYGLALPIALAVLSPTGIASLVNIADGKVPNLADIARRTAALEGFEATIGPEVSTLAATLAGLANDRGGAAQTALLGRVLLSIASLNAKVGIPSNAADSDADYLLDGTNSDFNALLGSSCKVMEGVRFPDDGAADTALARFQTYDTASVILGGVLLPAYTRYLRTNTGPQTGSVLANGFTYQNVSYTQKTMARSRVRYGSEFTVCTNSAFWNSGKYDPFSGIFTLPDGETFRAAVDDYTSGGYSGLLQADGVTVLTHAQVRVQEFWTDTVSETYWDQVVQAPQVIPGFHLAETVLIAQDQWLDAIGFVLPKLDAQGDVTVLVCEAGDNAAPERSAVLAQVTVPYASLTAGAETVASLVTPVFLSAGQRVSFILVTIGSHQVATTDGANFPQGTFFELSPTGFAQGDLTKHLVLNLYAAKFNQSVVSILLASLQLAGGITSIDILASTVVPGGAALTYEVQIASQWVPLSGLTVGQLNAGGALPPLLPFRATFAGTPDVMPALDLGHSTVHVSRPAKSFVHVWPLQPRTPPVSTSQVRVIVRYESFDPAVHSAGCQLLTGAGYASVTPPSSFSDVVTTDGALERTYVFNLAGAVASYKVKNTGTTTSALDTYHVAYIKDYCL